MGNLSGNINPLVTPPPSSRYGPESSKTKHPKSWAATLSAKRPREAASRYQEGTTTVIFSCERTPRKDTTPPRTNCIQRQEYRTKALPSPTSNTPGKEFLQTKDRKRKLSQEDEATLHSTTTQSQKRPRTSLLRSPIQETIGENTAVGVSDKEINPLEYWRKELRWPKEYFEPESNMNHLLARKKSSSSLRAKQSEAGSATPSSTTPSDQKPREAKSTLYTRPSYETVLATKGSFMSKFDLGITDASKRLCRTLLEAEQSVPQDTLFRDDLFDETCESVRARNEAMVVRDISPLICPSAQVLRIYGAKHLKPLNESVNEGWNSAVPFYGPRPQPDYSVGFGRSAFTNSQLEKLTPFV